MNLCDELKNYSRKTISWQQIADLINVHDERSLHAEIQNCIDSGKLTPMSSKTNGNNKFPLFAKYRVQIPEAENARLVQEIASLHSALQKDGYLQKHPEQYRKYRTALQALSEYLFQTVGIPVPVSRKERSFEIFGEEKQLDDSGFQRVLSKLSVHAERLAYYDTPGDTFYDFIPAQKPRMSILICENKDIWYNLRRMMFEQKKTVLWGHKIDGVLYGQGNQVTSPAALSNYTKFLNLVEPQYFYWGDIDREGFNIFLRLRQVNPTLSISMFISGYKAMLRLAEGKVMPYSHDHRNRMENYSPIYALFPACTRSVLKEIMEENIRVPQEIVSYAVLLQEMKSECPRQS